MPRHTTRPTARLGARLTAGVAALTLLPLAAGSLALPGASARAATGPTLAAGAVETAAVQVSDAVGSWREARRHAEEALAEAQETLTDSPGQESGQDPADPDDPADTDGAAPEELGRQDLTMTLRDLRAGLDHLDAADRRIAKRLLARPTDGDGDPNFDGYTDNEGNTIPSQRRCGPHVCVHWVTSTTNRVPAADGDSDGVPDQVELTRSVVDHVYDRIVTQGGYRAPLSDGPRGGDKRLDVYLADLGDENGLYGYCATEGRSTWRTAPGYCVLDNDYRPGQYPSLTPEKNLKVTAAHELFHAVQFAYDAFEDTWLMEGTAMWMEDEIYTEINDNIAFLRGSQLTNPTRPLDAIAPTGGTAYVSWIFWRYLSERHPKQGDSGLPLIIRDVWQKAQGYDQSLPATYSMKAADRALKVRGSSLTYLFARFGEANRHPRTAYREGAQQRYPIVPPVATYTLSGSKRQIAEKVATMAHMTNYTVVFRPGKGLAKGAWRLRVPLDMPDKARGARAQVSVVRANGSRQVSWVKLNARGHGVAAAPFNGSAISRVEVTLTNSGQRFRCNRGTYLSCQGASLDNGLKTYFTASVRKS